jgi:hypothetical protein
MDLLYFNFIYGYQNVMVPDCQKRYVLKLPDIVTLGLPVVLVALPYDAAGYRRITTPEPPGNPLPPPEPELPPPPVFTAPGVASVPPPPTPPAPG